MQETGSYKKHLDSLLRRREESENNTFRRWVSLCSTFISSRNSPSPVSPQCGSAALHPASVNLQVLQPFPLFPHPQPGWKAFLFGHCGLLPSCSFFSLSGPWLRGGSGGVWPCTTGSGSLGQPLHFRPQPQGLPLLQVQPAPLADHVKPCTRSSFLQGLGRRATGACGCGYSRRPGRAFMVKSPSLHWPVLIFLDEGSLKLPGQVSLTKLLTNLTELMAFGPAPAPAFLTPWNSKHHQIPGFT